ncbi:DUF4236 domain-containing protein [Bauldia sp.]|uniref:DUF4236 domain-containing protein n=1 Tax=Bauldia sp. TaxID=2575872 RepID=UPI003BAD65D5
MAFRFRQSAKIMPGVRLNLSKSGVSVSLGGKGVRHNIGPKGSRTTVGIPGSGVSWSHHTPYADPPVAEPGAFESEVSSPHWPREHVVLNPIESASAEGIAALSTSELAPILNSAGRRVPISPFVIVASSLAVLGLWDLQGDPSPAVYLAFVGLAWGFVGFPLDHYRRSVSVSYEPSGMAAEAEAALRESFVHLQESAAAWAVDAEGYTSDWKRNAGATELASRRRTYPSMDCPSQIRSRASFPCLRFGKKALYFLPDAVLFSDRWSIAAVDYRELYSSLYPVQFIQDSPVPKDATIVGTTWRFVNKDGGPDRRFNNNVQLPVCRYDELSLWADAGLRVRIQLSRANAGEAFNKVIRTIAIHAGEISSSKSVTACRPPKRWPTMIYITVALALFAGIAAAVLPGATSIHTEPTGEMLLKTDLAEPIVNNSSQPPAMTPDNPVRLPSPPIDQVPQSTAGNTEIPLPRLRPRASDIW